MHRSDFYYELPEHLIAQYPLSERSRSRLLCLGRDGGRLKDRVFHDLPALLCPDDLLVFNDTRVIPARLSGHKESGGRVEVLVERLLDERTFLAQLRVSRAPLAGSRICLDNGSVFVVQGRRNDFFQLCLDSSGEATATISAILNGSGHMPLPPYINRAAEKLDHERYQTVYARRDGAVAAPTAGLHFDQALLQRLERQGVASIAVTLHVGAGTFQPVRVDDIREHRMHAEYIEVSEEVCTRVRETRARGGRIVAVGTTTMRCLETAARQGEIEPYRGDTDIFITPGYRFNCVDALVTNFHFPESTLLMLVCAFGGMKPVLDAYRYAIDQEYRFFSYGDAMYVVREKSKEERI